MPRRSSLIISATITLAIALTGGPAAFAGSARGQTSPPVFKDLVWRHGVSSSTGHLWTMNADGTGQVAFPSATGKTATTINSAASDRTPYYSPDGTELAFSSTRSGTQHLYVASTSTGVAKDLTPTSKLQTVPVGWYLDESGAARIVYVSGQCSTSTFQLLSIRVDRSDPRPITASAAVFGRVAVSTNGELAIAGDFDGSGHRKIWVAKIPAGGSGTLTPDSTAFAAVTSPPAGVDDNSPAWSPSGALAFSRGADATHADAYLLAPGTTETAATPATVLITQGQEAANVAYSPDGTKMAYDATPDGVIDHYQVYVVAVEPATSLPATGDQGVQVTNGAYGDYTAVWK